MIYILVPYRNREKQLEIFTKYTKYLFQVKNVEVKIIICFQVDEKPFNRGLVLNCGIDFLVNNKMLKEDDIVIISDIDCLCPEENFENFIKNPSDNFRHIYGYNGLFHNFFYSLGTVISFRSVTFLKTNGFPNNLWGWGVEDLALGYRAKIFNVNIENNDIVPINEKKYYQLENPGNEPNLEEKLKNNSKNMELLIKECMDPNLIIHNGILNCRYKIERVIYRDYDMLHTYFF